MSVLTSQQRKLLDDACVKGRRASEQAVRAALGSLAITAERPPAHLGEEVRQLRRGLRAKSRQLGDQGDKLDLLIAECAYEQWHRLLFARFLAENDLLIHPDYRAPVTLEDCEELAESLGEPDGWSVAGRFAAEILPGIFRLDDPCVQLRLAPEGRLALEGIVAGLPAEIFGGDDALGWVYQYWQREQKDEVNRSERKIGGADIGPVTQLFTENYMVRFLLENSLGAWWAARHPNSPLVKEWSFLRVDEHGRPEAGCFEAWPATVAEITVMDPCCGSGHFLVEALQMLWRMRAEEEGVRDVDAQDSVLRDNLYGLELDPRCVQIAMCAVALAAWKQGGGWRELPVPHIACSGVPAKSPASEWAALAGDDSLLSAAINRLHILFRNADTFGSLIDPKGAVELSDPTGLQHSFDDVDWDTVAPLLAQALASDSSADPAMAVLGADAAGIARAADYLSRRYTLVATNVPYLGAGGQDDRLKSMLERRWPLGSSDLATAFLLCWLGRLADGGSVAVVLPQAWLYQASYQRMRRELLLASTWNFLVRLGPQAFSAISGEVVNVCLLHLTAARPAADHLLHGIDASAAKSPSTKAHVITQGPVAEVGQRAQLDNPMAKISLVGLDPSSLLSQFASSSQGLKTGDNARFIRFFWELPATSPDWEYLHGPVETTAMWGGHQEIFLWKKGSGPLASSPQARVQGQQAWGKRGVLVREVGNLPVCLYMGEPFQSSGIAVVPSDPALVPALWMFLSSPQYAARVREIDAKLGIATASAVSVPFDRDFWTAEAQTHMPDGLPSPSSGDPTQHLFDRRPNEASDPLQVAVGRLLGYRWPSEPDSEDLDLLADQDGIVCLPSVRGEPTAAHRLQEVVVRAFAGTWSPARTQELLRVSGSNKKDLDTWLREEYFKAHCQLFKNRPFIWQLWDGRKDGFSALVNYHRLNRPTLEKLTYSYLGDWIERQTAGVREDVAGAEERLAAARTLQQKLELILAGEPPYDIYVRWKSLAEQPIGWEPDLTDGVRMNVRPFVMAGVLRSKVNVKWEKDRGTNPDGSERLNDLHYTNAEKQAARGTSA